MENIWYNLILTMPQPRVITIIGGGGKTSLMYYLLTILKKQECIAVSTATTKLSSEVLKGHHFINVQSVIAGRQALLQAKGMQKHVTLVLGEDNNNPGKMSGIPSEWVDQLAAAHKDIYFVVEGDGAAGKPLKGHLVHEPVIPSSSAIVIVVVGIDSIGAKVSSQSLHRPERICELIGTKSDAIVTAEMIVQLLLHPQGYLHNCPSHSSIVVFINKVESAVQAQQAKLLAAHIAARKHPQINGIIIGSVLTEEGVWLQG